MVTLQFVPSFDFHVLFRARMFQSLLWYASHYEMCSFDPQMWTSVTITFSDLCPRFQRSFDHILERFLCRLW